MAHIEVFETPGNWGDRRCPFGDTGYPPRQWARVDGKYVVRLPLTTDRREEYISIPSRPPGMLIEFEVAESWLPNCGHFVLPDGRRFHVRNHDVEEVA